MSGSVLAENAATDRLVAGQNWIVSWLWNTCGRNVEVRNTTTNKTWHLCDHTEMVTDAAVHPSCPLLLTCSTDRKVKLYVLSVDEGPQLSQSMGGHTEAVRGVTWCDDMFASCGWDGTVIIYCKNPQTGGYCKADTITLPADEPYVRCIAMSGKWIAVGTNKRHVWFINRADTTLRTTKPLPDWADGLAFAHDGKTLLVQTRQGVEMIRDDVSVQLDNAKEASPSPDGYRMAVLTKDNKLVVTGPETLTVPVTECVHAFAWTSRNQLAVGFHDKLTLWQV